MSTPAPQRSYFTRHVLLVLAAAVCFFFALIYALGGSFVGSEADWLCGGLLALALSFLP